MSLFFILYVKHDNDLVPSIFFADFNWSQGFNFLKIFRNFNLKRCRFKYSAEETTLHEVCANSFVHCMNTYRITYQKSSIQ